MVLKETPGKFDLIFNDIFKREYPAGGAGGTATIASWRIIYYRQYFVVGKGGAKSGGRRRRYSGGAGIEPHGT